MADFVISAGHGDKIAGASGNGMTEVQEAQKVAKRVVEIIESNQMSAIYYQDATSTTQNANLANIVSFHNQQTRKIDVSIHFNSSGGSTSSGIGTEVFYKSSDTQGQKIAATVSAAIALAGNLTDRGAKTKSLRFTEGVSATAILIEIGFMNSSTDMTRYKSNFEAICQSIAYVLTKAINKTEALEEWKGNVDSDIKNLKLSVTQAEIQGSSEGQNRATALEGVNEAFSNASTSSAANSEGGFRVTTSGCLVIIDKQPLEETPGEPIYPDLVAPQKTADEYVQPIISLLANEEQSADLNQAYSIADSSSFESFIKKGIDIAKIFFDYEDYQKRALVYDNREHKYKSKIPNFGKPANNNDPFPVDEKIEELEQHLPFMKIHRLTFCNPSLHTVQLAKIIMDFSDKAEKRVAQLENNLATLYRNVFRLGSRMNINCVYYGGQSEFHKYKTIRCLHHDRVNDGQIMTLDQCLNCTRYEPILGKVYEIENELGMSEALTNDNNQMSYQQMQDIIDQTRLEEKLEPKEKQFFDLEQIKSKVRVDGDLDFKEMWPEGFAMNWELVPLEKQMPHVRYDDGRTTERLASNYKNIEHHNDPTGAGFEGIGAFYGPVSSTFMSTLGYGGGWNPQQGVTGGGTSIGAETTTVQSTEEVKEQVERNNDVFDTVPSSSNLFKYLEDARSWSKNVDSALRQMKSDFPDVEDYIKEMAARYNLDPLLVLSICIVESTGRYREGEGNPHFGLMAVTSGALPSNYMSLGTVEKMKANIQAGCNELANKRSAVWNTTNIVNIAIAYNAGQGLIIGNSEKGYAAVYSPGLVQSQHNTWTYDQIWSNFVRNLEKQWPADSARQEEKKGYYPKVHFVYQSLLSRDVSTVLNNTPVTSELGISIVFPYMPEMYKSKVKLLSDYGKRIAVDGTIDEHEGIDLHAGEGAPVIAASKGVVTKVTNNNTIGGSVVEITHSNEYKTIYKRLKKGSITVSVNQSVEAGTVIGQEGSTGMAEAGITGSYLHFEVRDASNKSIDPKTALAYLKGQLGKKIIVP